MALVTFAAETGLRTNEWAATERRDLERCDPAVEVVRSVVDGKLTPYPKTVRSRRRVPLTSRAAVALDGLPARLDTPLLFPAVARRAHQPRHLAHAQLVPRARRRRCAQARPYHLPHTFATEALAAGMPVFMLSRVMGCSVQMIERHYGHLAHDSEQAARALLDARAAL